MAISPILCYLKKEEIKLCEMPAPPDPKFLLRGDINENVHSLLFWLGSDVEHLYAGDGKGTVHIWDLKTNRIKSQLSDGDSPCFNLHRTNQADLIVQRRHGVIDMYKANESNWILSRSINYKYCSFCRSQLLPEEDAILVPLDFSTVGILSLKTSNIESTLDPSKLSYYDKLGTVMAMKPLDINDLVLVAYEGGQLLLWDMKKKDVLSSLTVEHYPMTFDFDVSLMQGILGSASEKLEIFQISPSNHTLSHKSTILLEHISGVSVLSIRPDKKLVTAGCWDGSIRLFSWKKLRPLAILKEHRENIYDIIYSQREVEAYDTKCLMAATGKEGFISMWDIYN